MEEKSVKKSNGGLIAVIVILVIAVLGLGGFIIYDKCLKKDDNKCKDNNTSLNSNGMTIKVVENKLYINGNDTGLTGDYSNFDFNDYIVGFSYNVENTVGRNEYMVADKNGKVLTDFINKFDEKGNSNGILIKPEASILMGAYGYAEGDKFSVSISSSASEDPSWCFDSDDEIAYAYAVYEYDKDGNYKVFRNDKYTVKEYRELHPEYCYNID